MIEQFIELNRTYNGAKYGMESGKTLSELLRDAHANVLVIIGDKGSGKTTEIKQFYDKNKNNSVWGHLNEVVNSKEEFRKKLATIFATDSESYNILLDSIDECRMLNNTKDSFQIALENLCDLLGGFSQKLKNTKILFTCRGSDWRGNLAWMYIDNRYKTDEDEKLIKDNFNKLLVRGDNKEDVLETRNFSAHIKIFQIDELSETQKKIIAKHYNINEEKLTNNLFTHFSTTPLECIQLLSFIGQNQDSEYSMDDFFLYQLRHRYRELNNYRESNIPVKVIEKMAKRLAVSTIFKRTHSISQNETYDSLPTNDSISVLELFPEENQQTIKDFIHSTIFSTNGSDRVKFWNEYAQNYMAYLWIKDRIANGKYREIVQLIFQEGHPKEHFVPSLVALSNSEPKIHKLLLKNHPELFIINSYFCSDMPSIDKENIINDILTKYPHRIQDMLGWGYRQSVCHFANTVDINFLLEKLEEKTCSEEKIYFVLELMSGLQNLSSSEEEKLKEILYKIIDKNTRYIQYGALEVLTKFMDLDNVTYLKKQLDKTIKLCDKPTIDLLLNALYPLHISLLDIINVIIMYRTSTTEAKYYGVPFEHKIPEIIENLSDEDLLQRILELLSTHLKDDVLCELYERFLMVFIKVCENFDIVSKYVLVLCKFEYSFHRYENNNILKIKQAIDCKKGLNRIIARDALQMLSEVKQTFTGGYRHWLDVSEQYYTFDDTCAYAYLENINKWQHTDTFNNLAMKAISWFKQNYSGNIEAKLAPYITENPGLSAFLENTKKDSGKTEFQKTLEVSAQAFEAKRLQNIEEITENIEHLKNLDEYGIQMLFHIASKIDSFNEDINTEKLLSLYNENISKVFLESIQKYWQIADIDFDRLLEIICKNKILIKSFICNMGISYFIKKNPDVVFNKDLSKKIVFYGLQILNSVPDYVKSCATKYPDVFLDVITPCINKIATCDTSDNYILWKLKKFPTELLNRLAPVLFDVLHSYPSNPNCYQFVEILTLINHNETNKKALIQYIITKIDDIENSEIVAWFVLLYQISLRDFLQEIKRIENKYTAQTDVLYSFLERLFSKLSEQNMPDMDIDTLSELVKLVYKYINTNQDIHRENMGVFTPTCRDNAQHFRSHLINLLSNNYLSRKNIPNLLELAKWFDSVDQNTANYLRNNADKLLLKNEDPIWSESKIVKFENEDYINPTNADELFDICTNKLLDIKDDLETSDYSPKGLYQHLLTRQGEKFKLNKEEYFQKYILMEMRRVSNKLYSAVREPEVANRKKPDLQIWNKNWCVNVECKIADNWTFKDLKGAIKQQLVGRYLKYQKYQHGIFLVARIKKKKWSGLDFDALILKLQEHANSVINNCGFDHIKAIKVIGIDYSSNKES